ncbi:MAG: hypothetical protein IKO01_00535 [Kiritimatiellae bacterium]|nr:hypothetical protein [Kiritimatiellia bacterium]
MAGMLWRFSNHWKIAEIFFQSLENIRKFFPIIGKTGPIFPTIGNFFSNHWKTRGGRGLADRAQSRGVVR